MIDYEQKIFNAVRPSVIDNLAPDGFKSVYVKTLSDLPVVMFYEIDNSTVRDMQSSSAVENYATITYEAQMCAMTKAMCRKIFRDLDEAMIMLGFNRISGVYVPNVENLKVFRYVARYQANIDPDGVIYRKP